MNINISDDIEGFQNGFTVKGKVNGIGHSGITLIGYNSILNKDNILKVNGKAYSDRPHEVYTKEPIETQIHAKAFAAMFDRLIKECDS